MWTRELYLKFKKPKETSRPLSGLELVEFNANNHAATARYAINRWYKELTNEDYQALLDVEMLALFEARCAKDIRKNNE